MNGNFLRSEGLLAVAIGAGVVIGATGLFVYENIFKKRRLILQQDVSELSLCVSQLRRELEELREAQRRTRRIFRNVRERSFTSLNEADNETTSADAEFDDEFFDLSDTDDLSLIAKEESDTIDAEEEEEESSYKKFDELFNGSVEDKVKVLGLLMDVHEQEPDNPEILWRLAKANYNMAIVMESEGESNRQKDYVAKGLEYATRCLDLNPRSADAHKWYAICIGGRSQFQGTKDKLKDGLEFRDHVEQALKIKPNDPTLHHLLGRFKFEVAGLSWIERKLVGTLFGEIPYLTYPEAIESLNAAEELSETPWKENRLLLAKAHLELQDYPAFLKWLELADKVQIISREDKLADIEIKELQKMALQRGLAGTL